MENDYTPPPELEPREPTVEDLISICRELNRLGARYLVVGGFAMRANGFIRQTMDVDIIVASDPVNETLVYRALEILPDKASRELKVGELDQYVVIRIADEIVVDLMKSAGGFTYEEAEKHVCIHDFEGVRIPFASPELLWRMKAVTHREKDRLDLVYLQRWFEARGMHPPSKRTD